MSNKKVMSIIEILLAGTVFLVMAVVIGYEPLGYGLRDYWRCLMVYAVAAWTWFLRHAGLTNRRFYAGHIAAVIAAALFGRNDNESFMYCIIVLIITLYSSYVMYKNQRPDKERISYVALIVMVAAYISGTAYGCSTVRETAVPAAAAFAILSVVYQNMFRINGVSELNKSTTNFPAGQLGRVNGWVLAVTVICMAAAMLAVLALPGGHLGFVGDACKVLGRGIATAIIWIIELLGKWQKTSSSGQTIPREDAQDEILGYMTSDNGDGNIENLINAVIAVTAIIIIVAVVIAVIKTLNAFMQKKGCINEGSDVIEFIKSTDKKEKIKHNTYAMEEKETGSSDERYRKLYRKAVKKGMKRSGTKTMSQAMIPGDITMQNITSDEKIAGEITRAYEIARYSHRSVSDGDIKQLKNISR